MSFREFLFARIQPYIPVFLTSTLNPSPSIYPNDTSFHTEEHGKISSSRKEK